MKPLHVLNAIVIALLVWGIIPVRAAPAPQGPPTPETATDQVTPTALPTPPPAPAGPPALIDETLVNPIESYGPAPAAAGSAPHSSINAIKVLDDFNRPDGPIGPNWTVHDGYCNVLGNAAVCGSYGRATFNGVVPGNGDAAEADIAVDGTALQYTGLLLNYGAGVSNLFLKVQQQNGTGQFDGAACYTGNNTGGFGLGYFTLSEPFSTAHMKATRVGDTVTIEFTNVDGGAKANQTYVCSGAPPREGNGIGILGYAGIARLDNFAAPAAPVNRRGLLYLTSLDIGNAAFAVYDPAADEWTTLANYETGCQMAASADGHLFAHNYTTGNIDRYDPASDTWSPVMAGPPGASGQYCNLEVTNAGEFLYTEFNNTTLWHTSGGDWYTLTLPFQGNAMGDYDPIADQYVVGERYTTNAHMIDVHTWAITNYTSTLLNGEYARSGVVLGGRYYFEADGSNMHSFELGNPAAPPFDHGVSPGWYTSAAADRFYGVVYNASLNGMALNRFDPASNMLVPLTGYSLATWHSSLAFVPGPVVDAAKYAPPFAEIGKVMSYTIVITTPELVDGLFMADPLPPGVEYAGNLTSTVGGAWYDDSTNTVHWEYHAPLLYGAAKLVSGGSATSNLYSIDPHTGAAKLIGPIGFDSVTGLAFLGDGRLVGSARGDALYGGTTTAILIEINPHTGAGTLIGKISDQPTGCGRMPDLTYDRATSTLYGYGDYCDGAPEGLFVIDPATGAGTPVGASGYNGGGNGLAIQPATGVIYATPYDDQSLVTLDAATGAGTEVPGSAGNVPYRINALAFDPISGDLYGSWNDSGGLNKLVTLSTVDGATTVIGPSVTGLDALVFAEPVAVKRAAAPASAPRPPVYDPDAVTDEIGDQVANLVVPAGPVNLWSYPSAVLWDNGPLVTHPGGGYNGADASALQSALGMNTYGFGHQFSLGYRVADEFEVANPLGWRIDNITFFAYQTATYPDPPPSTITGVYLQIWKGRPGDPGSSVVWGDLTTNRLISTGWTNIYRVLDTEMANAQRPIMANVADVGITLPPGVYWLDWMTDGSGGSGPWAPPITILGQTATGNALQTLDGGTTWNPANDGVSGTQQGLPFIVQGALVEPVRIEVTFDVTVTAACGDLITNVITAGWREVGRTFTATSEAWGDPHVAVEPPALAVETCANTVTTRTLQICNTGDCPLMWALAESPGIHVTGRSAAPARPQLPPILLPDGAPRSLTEYLAAGRPAFTVQPVAPASPAAAPEALTYYSSRPAFDAAFPGLPVEGYENGSMPNATIDDIPHPLDEFSSNAYFDPGDILHGIQFWASNTYSGDEIAVLGEQFMSNPSKTAVANYFVDSYRIVFNPPVWAVGMDLQEFLGSNSCQVDIYDTNGFLASTTSACNEAGVFWGAASLANPITQIVITSLSGGAEGADNIAFASAADIPWLSEDVSNGVVPPGGCQTVTVSFDSTGLLPNDYNVSLIVLSNDPDEPQVVVPVTLTVEPPEIAVEPPAVHIEMCAEMTATQTFQVCNPGNCPLTWALGEASGLVVTLAGEWGPNRPEPDRSGNFVNGVASDGVASDGPAPALLQNLPAALPPPPGAAVINFDDAAQPCVFANTVALRNQYAGQGVLFMGPAPLDGGGVLDQCSNFNISGHSAPNFLAFNAASVFSDGGIPRPPEVITFTNGASYVQVNVGSNSGAGQPITMQAFDAVGNSLGSNSLTLAPALATLSIAANGIAYVVIDTPAQVFVLDDLAILPDIPWLSEDVVNGIAPPGACQTVTLGFDSTGLLPNDYNASLIVLSNDPDAPQITVPVTMTVVTPLSNPGFSWTPPGPLTHHPVTFTGSVSGTGSVAFEWNYGDGGVGAGSTATHIYTLPGNYVVWMTATNACSSVAISHTLNVCAPLTSITIAGATSGYPGVYTFTTSYLPTNATLPITYLWDNGGAASTSVRTLSAGAYTLTVTATNCSNVKVVDTHTIVIGPHKIYLPLVMRNRQ